MSLVAYSDGVAVIFGVLYVSVGIGIFIGVIDKLKRVKGQLESAVPLVQLYQ